MSKVSRFDFRKLSKPVKTDAGFLKAPVFATRSGVFKYTKPDGSVIREYRPPSEVFDDQSMQSLAGVPVTNRHPTELVDAKNAKKFMVGFTSDKVLARDNFVETSVTITDSSVIEEIEAGGVREVSCGYVCDLDFTPGVTTDGERYDAIQKNIIYNHLAVVDRGRAGPEVRLRMDADAAIFCENQNANLKGDSMAKVKLMGDEYEVDESLAGAIMEALEEAKEMAMKEAMDKMKESEDEKEEHDMKEKMDKLSAKLDALSEENEKLKNSKLDESEIHAKVLERTSLIQKAKSICEVEKIDELTNDEIRRAVVAKELPEIKLDEKSSVYIEARFDHLVEIAEAKKADGNGKLKEALGEKAGKKDESLSAEDVRIAAMKADAEAWKKPLGKVFKK